jgi:hypothetical protein
MRVNTSTGIETEPTLDASTGQPFITFDTQALAGLRVWDSVVFAQHFERDLRIVRTNKRYGFVSCCAAIGNPDLCKDPNYVKRIGYAPLNPAYRSCGE